MEVIISNNLGLAALSLISAYTVFVFTLFICNRDYLEMMPDMTKPENREENPEVYDDYVEYQIKKPRQRAYILAGFSLTSLSVIVSFSNNMWVGTLFSIAFILGALSMFLVDRENKRIFLEGSKFLNELVILYLFLGFLYFKPTLDLVFALAIAGFIILKGYVNYEVSRDQWRLDDG
jgi:hypothetical protein